MLGFTVRAAEALRRSAEAAERFDPDARIRLTRAGTAVRATFVHVAEAGDVAVKVPDGPEVLAAAGLEGTVDAGDHDTLSLRP